jgi:hypothetical protein
LIVVSGIRCQVSGLAPCISVPDLVYP